MSRHCSRSASVFLFLAAAHTSGHRPIARSRSRSTWPRPRVDRVRAKYFAMDYADGVAEADRLLKQFPASRELAAWRVANLARAQRPQEAKAAANALLAGNRADAWGWFALTLYNEYAADNPTSAEVLDASMQAYRRAPNDPAVVWLRAFALSGESHPPMRSR